jgi:hypothetical protein
VLAAEVERIASELGRTVVEARSLAGGFSHETGLMALTGGDRVVVRFGGPDPRNEAAVMARAGACVPVPQVLRVLTARRSARPAMVLEYVAGTPPTLRRCARSTLRPGWCTRTPILAGSQEISGVPHTVRSARSHVR